jgi:hypothetical protein
MPRSAITRQVTPIATPATVNCDTAPRPGAEIIPLLQPPPGKGTPWPGRMVRPLPTGQAADAATTAAVVAVLRKLETCFNTGDLRRYNSFFSDDWFRHLLKREEVVAGLNALERSKPTPVPDGYRARFLGPWHVQILPDGRVLAAVVWFGNEAEPEPDPDRVKVLLFVRHDGRWLIDDMIDRVEVPDCHVPVPVAAVVGPPPGASLGIWPTTCEK